MQTCRAFGFYQFDTSPVGFVVGKTLTCRFNIFDSPIYPNVGV